MATELPTAPKTRTTFKTARAAKGYMNKCAKHLRSVQLVRGSMSPLDFISVSSEWNAAYKAAFEQHAQAERAFFAMV